MKIRGGARLATHKETRCTTSDVLEPVFGKEYWDKIQVCTVWGALSSVVIMIQYGGDNAGMGNNVWDVIRRRKTRGGKYYSPRGWPLNKQTPLGNIIIGSSFHVVEVENNTTTFRGGDIMQGICCVIGG